MIEVFVEAGRGLAAAHAAGLTHRDFKPDNVLIGPDGRARVADFGIAALTTPTVAAPPNDLPSSGEPAAGPVPVTSAIVGTPAFMSPEQVRGERATDRSDQWSFCVALHRAAYGVSPFPETDLPALLRAITEARVAPPPRRPDVPGWLAPIVLRGLARDPADRFPSMEALLAALAAHRPRDPDLDPAAVRAGRRALAAVIFALSIALASTIFGLGTDRALSGRLALVRPALLIVVVVAGALGLLRRRIFHNLYGRRLAGLLLLIGIALLAHRLLALRLGTPMLEVLAGDLVLLSAIYGGAAITFERWMGWLAGFSLLAATISAFHLPLAVPCFAATALTGTVVTLWAWGRHR